MNGSNIFYLLKIRLQLYILIFVGIPYIYTAFLSGSMNGSLILFIEGSPMDGDLFVVVVAESMCSMGNRTLDPHN